MKTGQPVEVRIIWAAGGPLKPPLRTWTGGYVFERREWGKGTVLVRHVGGTFDGLLSRWPKTEVRSVPS